LQWFARDDPVPVLVWFREKIRRWLLSSFRRIAKTRQGGQIRGPRT
jgi:hypothetical protein